MLEAALRLCLSALVYWALLLQNVAGLFWSWTFVKASELRS